jgi:hypothetical protein
MNPTAVAPVLPWTNSCTLWPSMTWRGCRRTDQRRGRRRGRWSRFRRSCCRHAFRGCQCHQHAGAGFRNLGGFSAIGANSAMCDLASAIHSGVPRRRADRGGAPDGRAASRPSPDSSLSSCCSRPCFSWVRALCAGLPDSRTARPASPRPEGMVGHHLPVLRCRLWRLFRRRHRHPHARLAWIRRPVRHPRDERAENRARLAHQSGRRVYFIFAGLINWPKAGVMTVGALAGYYFGAHFSQRIPQKRVRQIITGIGFTISAVCSISSSLR